MKVQRFKLGFLPRPSKEKVRENDQTYDLSFDAIRITTDLQRTNARTV